MHTLLAFTSAPLHAITVFFLLAKTASWFFPFGGSHSVNTNTGTVTVICWSVAPFSAVGCQTNLTGVPSQGQCWERIKTVKMATVTGSWHSLYLGMMSTFDIVWPCPEIVIPQLNSTARHRSPPGNEYLAQATFFPIYTWLSSLFLLLAPWLFIRALELFSILSFSSARCPSSDIPAPSSAPAIIRLPVSAISSLLFLASSGLYSCSHNLSTFPSLSLPLCPSICQLFLTVFQSLTPLNASVFLHRLHLSLLHAFPRSSFHSLSRASDEARE